MDILLVDDHTATREQILSLLQAQDDLNVVGQASGGADGVRQAAELHPDVIIIDVVMPGMNGIEATREIRVSDASVKILALSNHTGRNLVKALFAAGASGYVRKDHAYEELIPAVRAVAAGKEYVGHEVNE